jgi:hypothetical protein
MPMFGVKYREIKDGIFRMGTFWACSTLPFGISAPSEADQRAAEASD